MAKALMHEYELRAMPFASNTTSDAKIIEVCCLRTIYNGNHLADLEYRRLSLKT
jgi:hypothetical protein